MPALTSHSKSGQRVPGGYAQITSTYTADTASEDVTDLSCSITTEGGELSVEVWASGIYNDTLGQPALAALVVDGNTKASGPFHISSAANQQGSCNIRWFGTLDPGTYTIKVTLGKSIGSGNAKMSASATSPAFLEVKYV